MSTIGNSSGNFEFVLNDFEKDGAILYSLPEFVRHFILYEVPINMDLRAWVAIKDKYPELSWEFIVEKTREAFHEDHRKMFGDDYPTTNRKAK